MSISDGHVESGPPVRACWGPTVSEYLPSWGRHPGCGNDGEIGSSGSEVGGKKACGELEPVSVNGQLPRKAYGGGTLLGMRRRDAWTWEVST